MGTPTIISRQTITVQSNDGTPVTITKINIRPGKNINGGNMKESYTLKLEGKEWKDCLKEAYKKKKKDVRIDGFRKGQVPYVYLYGYPGRTRYLECIQGDG